MNYKNHIPYPYTGYYIDQFDTFDDAFKVKCYCCDDTYFKSDDVNECIEWISDNDSIGYDV